MQGVWFAEMQMCAPDSGHESPAAGGGARAEECETIIWQNRTGNQGRLDGQRNGPGWLSIGRSYRVRAAGRKEAARKFGDLVMMSAGRRAAQISIVWGGKKREGKKGGEANMAAGVWPKWGVTKEKRRAKG